MATKGPKHESSSSTKTPYEVDYPNLLSLYRMMTPEQQCQTLNRLSGSEVNRFFYEATKVKR